jgi:hypothetical protein
MKKQTQKDLFFVIEHGQGPSKVVAINKILHSSMTDGDFETLGELKELDESAVGELHLHATAEKFFDSISPNHPKKTYKSLLNFINNEYMLKKDKIIAQKKLPLFAMIHLYHVLSNKQDFIDATHGMPQRKDIVNPLLKEVKNLYDIFAATSLSSPRNFNRTHFTMPEELESGIKMSRYFASITSPGAVINKDELLQNNLFADPARLQEGLKYLMLAKEGDHQTLGLQLNDAALEHNDNKIDMINAVMPFAVLSNVKNYLNQEDGLLENPYELRTNFEKNSKVYTSLKKLSPLLVLEGIRTKVHNKQKIRSGQLANMYESNNALIQSYAKAVINDYLSALSDKHKLGSPQEK